MGPVARRAGLVYNGTGLSYTAVRNTRDSETIVGDGAHSWNVLHVWRTGDLADDDGQPIQRFGTRGAWHRLLVKNGLQVCQVHGYGRALPRSLNE